MTRTIKDGASVPEQEFTFHNVTITLCAADAVTAYNRLCELLGSEPGLEFTTDTFSSDDGKQKDVDTSELWPDHEPETEE